MREMTWDQMEGLEGGDWLDFVKGVACAAGFLGVAYVTGPVGLKVLSGIGAGATCITLIAM